MPIDIDKTVHELVESYSLTTVIMHVAIAAKNRADRIAELHEPRPRIEKNWRKAVKILVQCQQDISDMELELY